MDQVGPGRERRNAPVIVPLLDRVERGEGSDVEYRLVERRTHPRGVEVGAAGQHRQPAAAQRRERIVKRGGSQVSRHHGSLIPVPMIPERTAPGAFLLRQSTRRAIPPGKGVARSVLVRRSRQLPGSGSSSP